MAPSTKSTHLLDAKSVASIVAAKAESLPCSDPVSSHRMLVHSPSRTQTFESSIIFYYNQAIQMSYTAHPCSHPGETAGSPQHKCRLFPAGNTILLICKFAVPMEGHPSGTPFPHCFPLERGGSYLFQQILGTHHQNSSQSLFYCSSCFYFTAVMHRFGKSHQNLSSCCVMLILKRLHLSQYKLFPVN